MRLEKIDYILLAMLGAALLFATFKFMVTQREGLSQSSQSQPGMERKQAAAEIGRVPPESLEDSLRQLLMQAEQQSQAAQNSQAVTAEEEPPPPAELKAATADDTAAVKSQMPEEPRYFDVVYSMQVGVFKTMDEVVAFARRNSSTELYCRKKDNGYWGSYYGAYDSYSEAKSHLQDNPLLERVGAYVVKLSDTSFTPCLSLP
ncbi:MAG: hypothetical protein ACR2PT_01010 [Endozoicomonas sp.]